jgi:GT2 family glycosyltransferase
LKNLIKNVLVKSDAGRRCTYHVSQGDLANARKDWGSAIKHYKKALEINSELTATWIQLGHGYREAGDVNAAQAAYEKAVKLEPSNDDAHFFLALTLRAKGETHAAFDTYLKAFEQRPKGPAGPELSGLVGIKDDFADFYDAVEGLFDGDYYAKANSDIRQSGIDPKLHYMLYGWKEGRPPSAFFDPQFYRLKYRKQLRAGQHPLVHYWKVGRALSLRTNPSGTASWFGPKAPEKGDWNRLPPARMGEATEAVVIIPVYKGYDETLAAVYHAVVGRAGSNYSLLVINDCGPDKALNDELERLSALGLFDYEVNLGNLGFVQTCNRGILELSGNKDVVLLNSDAFVPTGWFDRIKAHVENDPSIATVTPLSNNATICSYPVNDADNFRSLELTPGELDALAAEANAGLHVETPTGVGFCFFMSRRAINDIGALDPIAFKLGYGEENDFCMRALGAGYKNVIATDIFVFHVGSVSFSDIKSANFAAGQKALDIKHPNYTLLTRRHVGADPARYHRRRLDAARLAKAVQAPVVFITHAWGGGIETYLNFKRQELDETAIPYVTVTVRDGSFVSIETSESPYLFLPNLSGIDLRLDYDFFCDAILSLKPSVFHVNSFAGLEWMHHAALLNFIETSGLPYRFIAHDYSSISRFYHLTRPDLIYRGLPSWQDLETWSRMTEQASVDISAGNVRRMAYTKFLKGADRVEFPSRAALQVFEGFYDGIRVEVVPHEETFKTSATARRRADDGRLRIASIGAIGGHKGSDVLLALARDAVARKLKIDYSIIGYSDQDDAMKAAGVAVTGSYSSEEEAIAHLDEIQPDFVFIASIWPETYCYTLSIPLALRLPFIVFDLGAQAERAATVPWSVRLNPDLINAPRRLSDAISSLEVDEIWATRASMGDDDKELAWFV